MMLVKKSVLSVLALSLVSQASFAGQQSVAAKIAQKQVKSAEAEKKELNDSLETFKQSLLTLRKDVLVRNDPDTLDYNVAFGATAAAIYAVNVTYFMTAAKVPARAWSATRYGGAVFSALLLAVANATTGFVPNLDRVATQDSVDKLLETLRVMEGQSQSKEHKMVIRELAFELQNNQSKNADSELFSSKKLMSITSLFILMSASMRDKALTKKDVIVESLFVAAASALTIKAGLNTSDTKKVLAKIDGVVATIDNAQKELN